MMLLLVAVVVQVASVLCASPFEWAGIFSTPNNTYLWTAQKTESSDGQVKYVDPTMKLVALSASAATKKQLLALEADGASAVNKTCVDVKAGGVIRPRDNACFKLEFEQELWQSLYTIDATGVDAVAFFTEHVPTEFENTAHYLKDGHGNDIEPVAELPEKGEETVSPWSPAIGSSILVNIVTLTGVIFLLPGLSKLARAYTLQFEGLTSAFAAGSILACAFFLLLFESTHLIQTGYQQEVAVVWRWGTMILAGYMLPALIHVAVDGLLHSQDSEEKVIDVDECQQQVSVRARVIGGVLIGDFFHNLCDGFFIAAAFKGCGSTFGWTVAGGSIAHEIAQEIADYFILTGSIAKLRPVVALGLNFLSGISVLLGAVIVLASDVSDSTIGLLLAFGGGVYVHIAATECMPKAYNPNLSGMMRACSLLMFIFGAVVIGLVLLDHEHCVPGGGEGGHHH
eukprot:TRINITY_DN20809_c0_g1_i2.p1 TRINITY_DN20809_c0_g1~~TRINITY_DN20809_c0_g1_i2.p1  ORF type:complete len:466 (-),score=58.40 TRINITY_DN20809_c0_g1_i2:338-1702(-)